MNMNFDEDLEENGQDESELKMIEPELKSMYDYDLDESEKQMKILIELHDTVKVEDLTIKLSEDRNSIDISLKDKLPFVRGKLLVPVASISHKTSNNKLEVTLKKIERGIWERFIVDVHPETKDIDPQSAFCIGVTYSPVYHKLQKSIELMLESSRMGFIPAMIHLAKFHLVKDKITGFAMCVSILSEAIKKYKSPEAMLFLGDVYLERGQGEMSMAYYKNALEENCVNANYSIGLALSPLSPSNGLKKNATLAIQFLEKLENSAEAKHHIALLYFNGYGVPKNLELAEKYQKEAVKIRKDIPKLEKLPKQFEERFKLFVSLLLISLFIGFVMFYYIDVDE